MITRIYNTKLIGETIHTLLGHDDVDYEEWVSDPQNIALINDQGDISIFEIGVKGIYSGHYCFKSKGREAIKSARGFLDTLFNTCYNIDVLMGLTPVDNRPARWISRQIGFKSMGIVEGPEDKSYEMFVLTKREFNNG